MVQSHHQRKHTFYSLDCGCPVYCPVQKDCIRGVVESKSNSCWLIACKQCHCCSPDEPENSSVCDTTEEFIALGVSNAHNPRGTFCHALQHHTSSSRLRSSCRYGEKLEWQYSHTYCTRLHMKSTSTTNLITLQPYSNQEH